MNPDLNRALKGWARTSIASPPAWVEYREEAEKPGETWLMPWIRCSWKSFKEANPEIASQVAADIITKGCSTQCRAEAPDMVIRHANQPEQPYGARR